HDPESEVLQDVSSSELLPWTKVYRLGLRLSLRDADELSRRQGLVDIPLPIGPPHLDAVHPLRRTEAKMEPRIIGRQVASRAAALCDLNDSSRGDRDPRANP